MTDTEIIRSHLESCLPPGAMWNSKNDFSDFLDAIAETISSYFLKSKNLKNIRMPDTTENLIDMADELGVEIANNLTNDEIKVIVKAAKKGVTLPGPDTLEELLQSKGFPVNVYRNGPIAVDPASFIGISSTSFIPVMCAGNEDAVAGNENAYAGELEGIRVLINGALKSTGIENEYDFILPTDPEKWNQIYFIGGEVERASDGSINDIGFVDIPETRKSEFENLVLKYGMADGWVGIFINYV